MKKIYTLAIGLLFILITTISFSNVNAEEGIKIYFVFNKLSYNSGDELIIDININDYSKVNEIKLGINKLEYFESIDTSLYEVNKNGVFTKQIINELDNNIYKLYLSKQSNGILSNGNNITKLKLKCFYEISDVFELFKDNITLYLFNSKNELLNYEIIYTEKLNSSWEIPNDEIEVNSEVSDYTKYFIVNNREVNEYDVVINQDIDSSKLGMQVISIIVFDKLNYDYLIFNMPINVVDKVKPILSVPKNININDTDITNLNIERYFKIEDNYDKEPIINFTYYDDKYNIIESYELFNEYLLKNKLAYLDVYGNDTSGNKTDTFLVTINIKDTLAPTIITKFENDIYVEDVNVDLFNLNDYFEITDNYDKNCKIDFIITDSKTNEEIIDVIRELKEGKLIKVEYSAIDIDGNKSNSKSVLLSIKDTQVPILEGVLDIIIDDVNVSLENIKKDVVYYDNLDKTPTLLLNYYIDDNKVLENEFIEKIKSGSNGKIIYQVIDKTGNKSIECIQNVIVNDTTPPTIELTNIKEGGKYLKIDEIKYNVQDNFVGDVDFYIMIDNALHSEQNVLEIGNHTLEIVATDKSGNQTIKKVTFEIIENNIKGCNGDIDCYKDNYGLVIVAVTVLMIVIITLVVLKIIFLRKKKKNEYKIIE